MPGWWQSIFGGQAEVRPPAVDVYQLRDEYERLDDGPLIARLAQTAAVPEVVAATAVIAERTIGLRLFDVQLAAAVALAEGHVVEMQTGEGKTLAAVPAIAWYARAYDRVHVLTANDYLARRDAAWMGPIYRRLGLSVAAIQQSMNAAERREAYGADIVYATANEIGFDYLRDQLALEPGELVLRPFRAAVLDEADSILLDEARIPLVIAGGEATPANEAIRADALVRHLVPHRDFTIEQYGRTAQLTTHGVSIVERALGCGNLFDSSNYAMLSAVHEALHAHTLLTRDVDYLVKDDAVLSIDEAKGRIVRDRRWPASLQTALDIKEGVSRRRQGRVLGSITVEHLVGRFQALCGMTGTAATQADDFREFYGLEVAVIPTHRPMIRDDMPDRTFDTLADKEAAVVAEICDRHAAGQPLLVGTVSVEESERLSRALTGLPHQVLNARYEEEEAAIIANAGRRGAVTISTNMAGRGVDIQLGPGVAALGGLHVIGTNRHESRRIDHQLRGRAGRQGDPGSSQFFVSREDPLMRKYGEPDRSLCVPSDQLQRIAEGQSFDLRLYLRKYESLVEGQRLAIGERRRKLLTGEPPTSSDRERIVALTTIDELWSDYLAAVGELRAGTMWLSLSGGDPFGEYVRRVHAMFQEFETVLDAEISVRVEQAQTSDVDLRHRGATWTYLTTDEPFGTMTARARRAVASRVRRSRA
jgi:preprotein translocase subunit SecA